MIDLNILNPKLKKQLLSNKTSLGDNPCFPLGDEDNFLSKLVSARLGVVLRNCKKIFDTNNIEDNIIIDSIQPLILETISLESEHKGELTKLGVEIVKEYFDLYDEIILTGEITEEIGESKLNDVPDEIDIEFDTHEEMEYTINSIYKRRFKDIKN